MTGSTLRPHSQLPEPRACPTTTGDPMACARGLLVPLLGLGLMLALSLPGSQAADCRSLGPAAHLTFAPAARARWLAPHVRAPGPLDHLYGTVRRFLSAVQLNPFPDELVRALLNEPASVKVDEVVRYEAGYVVCAVIAGLYLLVVPTAGLCFWCCHGRRHCGGPVKMERKELACERSTFMTFLLLTTFVLLIGVVCAFVTNQRVHEQTGPSAEAVPEMLLSLRGLVSNVPQELQAVAQQFSLPQKHVLKDLDGIAMSIGSTIHSQLRSTVYETLASLRSLGQDLQVSVDHLRALNTTLLKLQDRQQDLERAVSVCREQLHDLLQEPGCQGCADSLHWAGDLELGADFGQVSHVDDVLHRLKGVPEADFSSMVQEENNTFNALPLLASLQMADMVKELKKAVAQQPRGLKTLAKAFPDWEAAYRWSQALEKVENSSRPYLKEVQRYEKYRWIVGCGLCSVVLLVVICNLVGLNLGIWELSAREDPSHSGDKGRAGARVLNVGVCLSFLFAVPLILLVFSTFLVGGNVQTLVCRSWENGELYKAHFSLTHLQFADTPGNLPSFMNLSHLLGLKKNISILLAYQQCRKGAALWSVLQLNDSYDLETYLDMSQYTANLKQVIQNLTVDLENVDLLSPAGHRDLQALQSSGLGDLQYPDFLIQIQKPVVNTDMEKLAHELEGLAQTQGSSGLGKQLQQEAHRLRNLYQEKVLPQQSLVGEASSVLDRVTRLKGTLPAWATRILRNESECFLTREMGYFSQYTVWVREEVTQHIATCQPLSGALDNGRVILCDMMADPWNAFWFCMGWCTFLLVPSIIFAIKTSKYCHPIWKRLSSSSSEETQLFHIPRVTSLKL
ncbi:PREDICTED: prominin-2 isoform X3 [Hipposideros armiger]|uniref:Prominin-2 isoform X3 n=1 Tax=Hipposideros armiger TaxID=186990 RepID=A0A8B7SQ79_HIPAR|nr:PREDICTED: prominin-2 isoform X3 [Hipposideros armiger]